MLVVLRLLLAKSPSPLSLSLPFYTKVPGESRRYAGLSEMQAQQVRDQASRIGDLLGRGHARKDVFKVAASRRAGQTDDEEAGRGAVPLY